MIYRFLGDHKSWVNVEMLLGLCSLIWGLVVLWPYSDTFISGDAYRLMIGPEWAWGLLFSLCGLCELWAVWKRRHPWRMVSSALGGGRWAMLGVFFLLGNPQSAIAPFLILFALTSLATYLSGHRCHLDARGRCNGIAEAQLMIVSKAMEEMLPGDASKE